jgi:hypothetical protein
MINKILKLAQKFKDEAEISTIESYLGDGWTLSDDIINLILETQNINTKNFYDHFHRLFNTIFPFEKYSILLSFLYGDNDDNYKLYVGALRKVYEEDPAILSKFPGRVRNFKKENKI